MTAALPLWSALPADRVIGGRRVHRLTGAIHVHARRSSFTAHRQWFGKRRMRAQPLSLVYRCRSTSLSHRMFRDRRAPTLEGAWSHRRRRAAHEFHAAKFWHRPQRSGPSWLQMRLFALMLGLPEAVGRQRVSGYPARSGQRTPEAHCAGGRFTRPGDGLHPRHFAELDSLFGVRCRASVGR